MIGSRRDESEFVRLFSRLYLKKKILRQNTNFYLRKSSLESSSSDILNIGRSRIIKIDPEHLFIYIFNFPYILRRTKHNSPAMIGSRRNASVFVRISSRPYLRLTILRHDRNFYLWKSNLEPSFSF